MRKIIQDIEVQKKIYAFTISGLLIFLGIEIINRFDVIKSFFNTLISALSPFIWGVIFAFFLCKFADFVEAKLPENWKFKKKRSLSSVLSLLLLITIIVIIIMLIVPQLISSVASLSNTIIKLINNPPTWLYEFENDLKLSTDITSKINDSLSSLLSSAFSIVKSAFPNVVNGAVSTVSGLVNFIIGFIVCLYVLNDREHLLKMTSKFFKALLPEKAYTSGTKIYYLTIQKIYLFFEGKLLDSLIVGIICFIFMIITGYEYSLLIAVIIGITNIIPFFGPLIGAIPCALILLINNPVHALVFLIFIVVLQQLDGNVIGPKIIGDSVGLSSLWIMFAILVGSAYFGFIGMLLGVPVFSVIYILIKDWVNTRLEEKSR